MSSPAATLKEEHYLYGLPHPVACFACSMTPYYPANRTRPWVTWKDGSVRNILNWPRSILQPTLIRMSFKTSFPILDHLKVDSNGISLVWLALAGAAAWIALRSFRNCFWHPLSSFPGPRIAAITTWYKAYIDCVAKTSFVHTLERLHEQHGTFSLSLCSRPLRLTGHR